jgi:hypothetical protein
MAMRAGTLALLLFLVGAPQTARAGYSFFMTPVANPGTVPFVGDLGLNDPAVGGDWVSYILGVSSNDGSRIGAVDVDLKGLFHQRWNWDVDAQAFGATPSSLGFGNGDSHLMPMSGALFAVAPTEDSQHSALYGSLPDVPGAIDYGVGSRMRGVWGIPGGNATSLNLAHVVIPRGSEMNLEYAIDVAGPTGELQRFRQGASFPFPEPAPIPEPLPPVLPVLPTPIENPIPPVTTLPTTTPGTLPQPPVWTPPAQLPIPLVDMRAEQVPWSPESGLPVGYSAYRLTASSGSGSLIAAVDVRVNGSLHQTWADLDEDGNIDPTPRGLANGLGLADSHLNIPESGLTMPLTEDIGEIADGMGLGTHLGGAWGVPLEMQSSTEQIAYLVVPDGVEFGELDINIDLAVRQGDAFYQFMDLKGHGFNYMPTIESPALPTPEVPPLVDPSQQPPLVIDPPPVGELPLAELPPISAVPPGEGEGEHGEGSTTHPITTYPIYTPEIITTIDVDESRLVWICDDNGLAVTSLKDWTNFVVDADSSPTDFVAVRQSMSAAQLRAFGQAATFAAGALASQGDSSTGIPEPCSAVLLLVGASLAAGRAGRTRG